jgi:hypothetical protein
LVELMAGSAVDMGRDRSFMPVSIADCHLELEPGVPAGARLCRQRLRPGAGFWLARQHDADYREDRSRRYDMANQEYSDVGLAPVGRRPRRAR